MKKSLVLTLALVFVLGIASTAFAAANPFVDVPARHWSYEAVAKLAQAGIVEGYGDGTFRGDQEITRYEMAQIVAKALAKSDKADAEQKAIIDKLAVEFASELNNLGVRVAKLEKNASNIKITGESRLRYSWLDEESSESAKIEGSNAFDWRQRLHLSAQITDKITYGARIEATGKFDGVSDGGAKFGRNFFAIKDLFGINNVVIGRQGLAAGRYLAIAKTNNNDGISFTHKFGSTALQGYFVEEDSKTDLWGVNLGFNTGKDLEFNVGYISSDPTVRKAANPTATPPVPAEWNLAADYLNAGFALALGKGVSVVGDYVQSDADGDPKAYAAQFVYNWKSGKNQKGLWSWEKIVNPAIAHDQAIALTYRSIEQYSLPGAGLNTGTYGTFGAFGSVEAGNQKGYSIGYQNAVAKNVLLSLEYHDVESKDGSKLEDKQALAYFEFFF